MAASTPPAYLADLIPIRTILVAGPEEGKRRVPGENTKKEEPLTPISGSSNWKGTCFPTAPKSLNFLAFQLPLFPFFPCSALRQPPMRGW
jgi:hypothetical protein